MERVLPVPPLPLSHTVEGSTRNPTKKMGFASPYSTYRLSSPLPLAAGGPKGYRTTIIYGQAYQKKLTSLSHGVRRYGKIKYRCDLSYVFHN
jgi:hypothetical protein